MSLGTPAGRASAQAAYAGASANSPSVGPMATFSTDAYPAMKDQDYFSQ
jgi:hypothetical protein